MAMLSSEEISRRLSQTLDCLGYSPGMVRFRKNAWNVSDKITNNPHWEKNNDIVFYRTVGSRGEGMVKFYESDWDQLIIRRFVIVVEDIINVQYIPEPISVFLMVPCLLHPGHCKLLLIRKGTGEHFTDTCLNPFENGYWLSSKEFMTVDLEDNFLVSGPAQTSTISKDYSADYVLAFPCVCSRILHQWLQRPRRYDWPPIELRDQITRMTGNIVATGQKGCPDEEIEWRLCFNEIELLLVDTWNDTQRKLYKVLKMIKKDAINKEGFNISSYIMKNIVLWFSETYPQSEFRPENLLPWVFKSLKLLRKVAKVYNLPYYMILGRNLIAERVPWCQRKSLIKEISHLIYCGPKLLWECEKLVFAMSMTLNKLHYYSDRCDRYEVLVMMHSICYRYSKVTNTDNTQLLNELLKEKNAICSNSSWPPTVSKKLRKYGIGWFLT